MPRGDRTGPSGMGPLTGRGAGDCSGSALPGSAGGVGAQQRVGVLWQGVSSVRRPNRARTRNGTTRRRSWASLVVQQPKQKLYRRQTMPRGDRTGPNGMGPMTGRGAGYCAGYNVPGYMNPGPGYGAYGRGYGLGMAWRRGWGGGGRGRGFGAGYAYPVPPAPGYAPYPVQPSADAQLQALKTQAEYLQSQLESINGQIANLAEQDDE